MDAVTAERFLNTDHDANSSDRTPVGGPEQDVGVGSTHGRQRTARRAVGTFGRAWRVGGLSRLRWR
jgi:hypothetical protein